MEPAGVESEKMIVGKSSEGLKCNICSVPLEQQLKLHSSWNAVEAAQSEIDISKPGQINPRTLCMTGLHFRLARKWFGNLGTLTRTGEGKDGVGKWDAENGKKKEIAYKKLISQSIPDVPVCYHPVCLSSLLLANGMLFFTERYSWPL